jgi:RNA polymerase sigma-70 factor (ECF subfamily)
MRLNARSDVLAPPVPNAVSDLIRRAQQGDPSAFDRLYEEHVEPVYALCLRMAAGDAAEAETLTQDVFVHLWRHVASFRGECAFSSWLHRVTVRVVLTERRAASRREARVAPVEDPGALEGAVREPASPLDRLELDGAVARLPEGARQVLVLHDVEGYTHEEIAGLMGTSTGTTKSQLHRARRLLRELYLR